MGTTSGEGPGIGAQEQAIRGKYSKISKNIFRGYIVGAVLGVLGAGAGLNFMLRGSPSFIEQINPKRNVPVVIQYNETLQDRRDIENSIEQLTTMRNSLVPELPYQIEEVQPLLERAFSDSSREAALDFLINRYRHSEDTAVGRLDDLERDNSEIKVYRKWDNAIKLASSLGLTLGGMLLYVTSLFGGSALREKVGEKRDEEISKLSALETQATS